MAEAEELVHQARQVGLGLLSACDRTMREMRERLAEKFPAAIVDQVVADFARLHLLDDGRLARHWVESRLTRRPAPPARLAEELEARGVDPELVAGVLEGFTESLEPEAAALAFLRRQKRRYAGLQADKARRRMFGMLARRGYEQETALKAVAQVWQEMQDDVEGD